MQTIPLRKQILKNKDKKQDGSAPPKYCIFARNYAISIHSQ